MAKSINDLNIKNMNELIIPDQLQGFIHLTSYMIDNRLDDSSFSEILKLIDDYKINPYFVENLLYTMFNIFPHKSSSFLNIGEMIKKTRNNKKI